ncbi:hypothetical protein H5410_043207 [Solanum commersonii]|uniref:Uncharacterized protein n=1 Tax=Solanum commersonii TaxID=4109 RepID=A0A9J5XXT6_SOLCO|nr:hypothetical protein H5410_043207 [Solanum commersonii]
MDISSREDHTTLFNVYNHLKQQPMLTAKKHISNMFVEQGSPLEDICHTCYLLSHNKNMQKVLTQFYKILRDCTFSHPYKRNKLTMSTSPERQIQIRMNLRWKDPLNLIRGGHGILSIKEGKESHPQAFDLVVKAQVQTLLKIEDWNFK